MVSINALGRFADASVAKRKASNSAAARSVGSFSSETSTEQPHLHAHSLFTIFSAANSLKLGNWLVPNKISLLVQDMK